MMVGSEGLKPRALTAALWLDHSARVSIFLSENRCSLLSLPPVATISPAGDSLSPHISCSWARYLKTQSDCLKSLMLTYPSLPPEQTKPPVLPTDPTLPRWMPSYLSYFCFCRSNRAISPLESPRTILLPPGRKLRPHKESPSPLNSCTLETRVAQPDHRYKLFCRPTPICPESAQSSKLRQKSSLSKAAGKTLQGWGGNLYCFSILGQYLVSQRRVLGLLFYFSSGQSPNLSILGTILGAKSLWPRSS